MTIKHMSKNISAEKTQVVTNITSSPNGLLVTKTNLHDETSTSDTIDLTDTKLHLMILNNSNDLDLLADCDTNNKLSSLNNQFESEYQISFDSLTQLNDYIQSKIFLVEDSTSENENNIYNEYIWMNGDFELIGTTEIELDGYVQKSNTSGVIKNNGDILPIDNTSGGTGSSTNLITSGAVNAGLNGKADSIHNHSSSNITDMDAITITITYADANNTTETLTLFKQVNNS